MGVPRSVKSLALEGTRRASKESPRKYIPETET